MTDRVPEYDPEANVRLKDIETFLRAYELATGTLPVEQRDTFEHLLNSLGKFTTTMGQLERVVKYFFDRNLWSSLVRRSEAVLLFDQKERDGLGLQPTPEATALYQRLNLVSDFYEQARRAVWEAASSALPVVTMGTVQTIGLYVITRIFSDWRQLFGNKMLLNVEMDNSLNLIPRVHAGLLDFVIAYGRVGTESNTEAGFNVRFQPIGLNPHKPAPDQAVNPRLILITHPLAEIWQVNGKNANTAQAREQAKKKGMKTSRKKAADGPERPEYDELPEIMLEQIDPFRTRLIVVPSWYQPKPIQDFVATHKALLREAPSYDEALALSRMAQGAAIVTEIFHKRSGIVAFKLTPSEEYARAVGVYYNPTKGLTPEAYQLVKFIDAFMWMCATEILDAAVPTAFNKKREPLEKRYQNVVATIKAEKSEEPAHLQALKPGTRKNGA